MESSFIIPFPDRKECVASPSVSGERARVRGNFNFGNLKENIFPSPLSSPKRRGEMAGTLLVRREILKG